MVRLACRNRAMVTALAVVTVVVVIVWFARTNIHPVAIDLVDEFHIAEKSAGMPMHQAFAIGQYTIYDDKKIGIFAHSPSRIKWDLTLPEGSSLRTFLGIPPRAWEKGSDGVRFQIAVLDGRDHDRLFSFHLNPRAKAVHRRWIPVNIDLSHYGGRRVVLIFKTHASLPGAPANNAWDWAVWGTPEIYISSEG